MRFVRDLFHVEPDAWQRRALEAWTSDEPRKRIAMQACAGPGKSAVLAWCGWHALVTWSDGTNHPNGLAVSITGDNLKDGLWKELAVWRSRAPLLQRAFEMTTERIFAREAPQTWFLGARTFAKSADAEAQGRTLSGLHATGIFYLLDETGDMPTAIGRSAEQGLSNCERGRIAQAGNPTNHTGLLYQSVVDHAHLWHVITITGDPEDSERSPRIPIEWAQEQIGLYGRDNPWVIAYILGQFPPGGLNALLSPDEVRAAMKRHLLPQDYEWSQKRLGIDCARFGDDRTVLFPRQGLLASKPVELRGKRGPDIAARALAAKQRWQWEVCLLDATGGWGQSTEDSLLTAGEAPVAVEFHAPAINPRYANRRAEMWWEMAEWVKRGGVLPRIDALVPELSTVTYSFKNGKLLMEPKEQVKARLGRSPDLADALALTFALPDQPASGSPMASLARPNRLQTEYDPWAQEAYA